jgi:glycosyltransferase involved in cell wall biosynthesis
MFRLPLKYNLYHIANAGISFIAKRLNPCVITVHDLIPFMPHLRGSFTDVLLRKSMKSLTEATRIICVSESTKNDLIQHLNVEHEIIRIIYHGVDHNLFKPRDKEEARKKLGLPQDQFIILHVGSEEPRKNILTLLKAFKRLLNDVPNAVLIRIGEKTVKTQNLIKSLNIRKKVLYFFAESENLPYFYNAADLLSFPSYYEGFGHPPLEAMASGVPVIASNKTSIPEIVGEASILLDPFDVDEHAYHMREVLTNEDLNLKLSKKVLTRSNSFSWEKCAEETLEVYSSALNS